MATDRKTELSKKLEELRKRKSAVTEELSKHEASRDANQRELAALQERRETECENEALYGRSDLGSVDAKIKATQDRLRGFERLVETKKQEAKALDDQAAPLDEELRKIRIDEETAKQIAEIEEEAKTVLSAISARDEAHAKIVSGVRRLRERNFSEVVARAGSQKAFELERLANGMRP